MWYFKLFWIRHCQKTQFVKFKITRNNLNAISSYKEHAIEIEQEEYM